MLQVENSLTCPAGWFAKGKVQYVSCFHPRGVQLIQVDPSPPKLSGQPTASNLKSHIFLALPKKKTLFFEAFHFTRLEMRVLYYRRETERLNAVITMPVRTAQ